MITNIIHHIESIKVNLAKFSQTTWLYFDVCCYDVTSGYMHEGKKLRRFWDVRDYWGARDLTEVYYKRLCEIWVICKTYMACKAMRLRERCVRTIICKLLVQFLHRSSLTMTSSTNIYLLNPTWSTRCWFVAKYHSPIHSHHTNICWNNNTLFWPSVSFDYCLTVDQ